MIFYKGKIAETYNIGGFNEWKNIDIIKVVIKTVDRLLGRPEGADLDLITYPTLQQPLVKNLKIPNEILDIGSFLPIS